VDTSINKEETKDYCDFEEEIRIVEGVCARSAYLFVVKKE